MKRDLCNKRVMSPRFKLLGRRVRFVPGFLATDLTWPFSTSSVSMTIDADFDSQIILQKSSTV